MKALLALDARGLAEGGRRRARPRLHRRAHDRHRGAARRSRRDHLGRDRGSASGLSRAEIEHVGRRLCQARSASSSATAWASPSIATAPATCSRSPTCCCCAAISAARAPASARCAAIRTCRATAPSASPRCRTLNCWTARPRVRLRAAARTRPRRRRGDRGDADGRRRRFVCLGGNFAVAMSRSGSHASRRCASSISRCTSPPSSIARICSLAKTALILPCLGRTEIDMQADGPAVGHGRGFDVDGARLARGTEAGVRASQVGAGHHRRHGAGDIAGHAGRLGRHGRRLRKDPRCDRGGISGFCGLQCPHQAAGRIPAVYCGVERQWLTPTGKANFIVYPGVDEDPRVADRQALMLTTIRSHDQYNTTIYGFNDRYRGITGRRDVVFVNERDLPAAA